MKRSTERILTTHAGRLEGPPELRALVPTLAERREVDREALEPHLRAAIVYVLREQAEAGIDVVSDGEMTRFGYGFSYYGRRLGGLTTRKVAEGEPAWMALETGERQEFAEFYATLPWRGPTERIVCTGPITYIGAAEMQQDLEFYRAALAEAGVRYEEAFMCA